MFVIVTSKEMVSGLAVAARGPEATASADVRSRDRGEMRHIGLRHDHALRVLDIGDVEFDMVAA